MPQPDRLPILLYADSYRSADIYHASGFLAPDPFTYLERDGERIILASALEVGRARKESRATAVREMDEFGAQQLAASDLPREDVEVEVIRRFLDAHGAREVAVPKEFPVYLADGLRSRGITLRIEKGVAERRRCKRADELAAIEETQRATEAAFELAVDLLRRADIVRDGTLVLDGTPLTAERVRGRMEVFLLDRGFAADGTIVAPGAQAADPHKDGSGPYRAGEAIVMDVFPQHKRLRYYADMTRTVCRGEASPEIARMYEAVLAAQTEGIAAVRPGVTGREVHERVEDVLFAAGYATLRDGQRREGAPALIHSTGHGVGLEIHEAPYLGRSGRTPLEVGDVVTIEPGLYHPGIGGVRLEDMVVVTETGCRNLTKAPKQLPI